MKRWVDVEPVTSAGSEPTQTHIPVIPAQWNHPRNALRSRDLALRLPPRESPTVNMLSSFEPARQRSQKESRRTPCRTYEGNLQPAWREQPTNSGHGSPDEKGTEAPSAVHRARRAGSRYRPPRESSPLRATFLMLPRFRGAIGRPRAATGALSTAGRSVDGPEARMGQIPGVGKGITVAARCALRSLRWSIQHSSSFPGRREVCDARYVKVL